MSSKRISAHIGADVSEFRRNMLYAQKELKRTFGPEALRLSEKLRYALVGVAAAMGGIALKSFQAARENGMLRQSFQGLIGSLQETKKHMSDIETFAVQTPFDYKDVADMSRSLINMGYNAKQSMQILYAAGEAATRLGRGKAGAEAITKAFGDMRAKGKISTGEINSLIKAGLPAWDILAEQIGVSVPEAMEKVKSGALSTDAVITALVRGTGKRYAGSMIGAALEIDQSISSISDSIQMMFRALGEQVNLKDIFSGAAKAVREFALAVKEGGLMEAINRLIDPAVQTGILAVAAALLAAMIPALIKTGIAAWTASAPLLPWIALAAGVAAAAVLIHRNWAQIEIFFKKLGAYIVHGAINDWYTLKDGVIGVLIAIGEKLSGLGNLIPGVGDKIKGVVESLRAAQHETKQLKADNITKYNAEMEKLNTAAGNVKKNLKEIKTEIPGADVASAFEAVKKGVDNVTKSSDTLADSIKQTMGGLDSAIADVITGAKSAADVVQDLSKEILRTIIKSILMNTLLKGMAGGMGGGGGMALNAADALLSLPGAATGALVMNESVVKVAETEPELITPISKAADTLGRISGGGGSKPAVVHVHNNLGVAATAEVTTQTDMENTIINIVLNAAATNKRGMGRLFKNK